MKILATRIFLLLSLCCLVGVLSDCKSKSAIDPRVQPTVLAAASAGYGIIWVTPIDGTSDDSVRLHQLMIQNAYKNAIGMMPGPSNTHWKILNPFLTPSGTWIIGTPQTVIDAAYVGGALVDGIIATFFIVEYTGHKYN
jgi:hypothetical protein